MTKLHSELLLSLEKLIQLLLKHGEETWGKGFSDLKELIESGNKQGVISLTQMRGGMGSFFDLAICKINGHNIEPEEEAKVNKEIEMLSVKIFDMAREIRISE